MFGSKLQQSTMVAGKPCWMICLKHGCSDKTFIFKGSGSNLATPYSFSKAAALDGLHCWKRGQFYWLRDGKPCSAFKGTGLASYSEAWQGWSCDTSGHKTGNEVERKFQAVAKVHVKGYYVIQMVYIPEPWIKMIPLHLALRMGQSSDVLFSLPRQPCFISQHLVTVGPKTRELVAQHGPSIEHVLSRKQQFTSWEQQSSLLEEFQVEAEERSLLNDFLALNAFLYSWHGANKREHYREKAQSGQMVDRLESGPVLVFQLKCGYRSLSCSVIVRDMTCSLGHR